jgi:hypothetical protein
MKSQNEEPSENLQDLEQGDGIQGNLGDEPMPYCGTCGSFVKESEGFRCEECERICHETCRLKHPDSLVLPICNVCGKDAIDLFREKEEQEKENKEKKKQQGKFKELLRCAFDAFNEADDVKLKKEIDALKKIGKPARDAFVYTLKNEKNEIARDAAVVGIAMMGFSKETEEALIFTLQNDSSTNIRIAAIGELIKFESEKAERALIKALEFDKDQNVRLEVIRAFEDYGYDKHYYGDVAQGPLIKAAKNDECEEVRIKADEVRKGCRWLTKDERDREYYGTCITCDKIFRSTNDYKVCYECNPSCENKEEKYCHICMRSHFCITKDNGY